MKVSVFLLIISIILMTICSGEIQAETQELNTASKGEIIDEIASLIREKYVFPDVAEKIVDEIYKKQKEKSYDQITSLSDFLQRLTKDLRSINNDAHLSVIPRRGSVKDGISPEEMYKAVYLKRGPFQNYGFKKAERLLGNIGCLVLDEFSYVEWDGENVGGETARAAMQMLSKCYVLIIDLRDNFGGREEMALLLLDYFFDEPVHLLSNRYRGKEETEIWTRGEKSGGPLAEIPLYVLTSQHTVSGGEMFAYVLKNRKRAVIIGEKTRGAAHRTHLFSLKNSKIDIAIPVGTTIDPETEADWEGKGVQPDINVPSSKAMDVAYKKGLETIIQAKGDRSERYEMQWALMEVDARLNPSALDATSLHEYVGVFGERKISISNGVLYYQREGQSAYALKPMSEELFSFVDKGMFYVRIRFRRDTSGAVDTMIMIYDTGQKREYSKNENN